MFNFLEIISNFILNFISHFGYFGVFILSLLESAGIPIPSEVVVPFSGFLVSKGRFDFFIIVIITTLANLSGAIILYFISLFGGRKIFENYGRYFFISKSQLEKMENFFLKFGNKIIFFGRIMPLVRTFISIPAGLAKMDFLKFVIYTGVGSFPWNFVLALIGFKAGENWNFLSLYFRKFDFAIIGIIIILLIWYVLKHIKDK